MPDRLFSGLHVLHAPRWKTAHIIAKGLFQAWLSLGVHMIFKVLVLEAVDIMCHCQGGCISCKVTKKTGVKNVPSQFRVDWFRAEPPLF